MKVVDRFKRLKEQQKRLEENLLIEIAKLMINGEDETVKRLITENWEILKKYSKKKGVKNEQT